jgi:hypothetical protein
MYGDGFNNIDKFALAISCEFIPHMSETRREFVKAVYGHVLDYPEWVEPIFAYALNNVLDYLQNTELTLFWFRKNCSMLEEYYLRH